MQKQILPVLIVLATIVVFSLALSINGSESLPAEVKQQTIHMSADDFIGDPTLERAMQSQLDPTKPAPPVPSNPLQSTAPGIQ